MCVGGRGDRQARDARKAEIVFWTWQSPRGHRSTILSPAQGALLPSEVPGQVARWGGWGTVSPLQALTHLAPPGVFPALCLRKG